MQVHHSFMHPANLPRLRAPLYLWTGARSLHPMVATCKCIRAASIRQTCLPAVSAL